MKKFKLILSAFLLSFSSYTQEWLEFAVVETKEPCSASALPEPDISLEAVASVSYIVF